MPASPCQVAALDKFYHWKDSYLVTVDYCGDFEIGLMRMETISEIINGLWAYFVPRAILFQVIFDGSSRLAVQNLRHGALHIISQMHTTVCPMTKWRVQLTKLRIQLRIAKPREVTHSSPFITVVIHHERLCAKDQRVALLGKEWERLYLHVLAYWTQT